MYTVAITHQCARPNTLCKIKYTYECCRESFVESFFHWKPGNRLGSNTSVTQLLRVKQVFGSMNSTAFKRPNHLRLTDRSAAFIGQPSHTYLALRSQLYVTDQFACRRLQKSVEDCRFCRSSSSSDSVSLSTAAVTMHKRRPAQHVLPMTLAAVL